MKKIISYISLFIIIATISCSKDETRVYLSESPAAPSIVSPSSGTSEVLTQADSANLINFNWTKADFGFQSSVTYELQVDAANNSFKDAINLASITDTASSVTVYSLNNSLLTLGLTENTQTDVELRVRAIISGINNSSFADTVISSTLTISVTLFEVIVNYPKLYVPGSYQYAYKEGVSWSADYEGTVISSVKSNNKYEGYLYFADASTEFKLTKVAAWEEDNTIGDADASGTSGKLQIGSWGGNNIKVTGGPGYFKINADLTEATYTAKKTEWSIIGDAAIDWSTDVSMTFDTGTKLWTVTTNLKASGGFKFRANELWDLNYGDTSADNKLDAGGDNITVSEDGNYTVTLDLNNPVYKYTLVKN